MPTMVAGPLFASTDAPPANALMSQAGEYLLTEAGEYLVWDSFTPADISDMRAWWDAASYSGSGTSWPDTSGNGLHLTLVGTPAWTTHANGRKQFEFRSASSQYATLLDASTGGLLDFGATDSFSAVVICQHAALSGSQTLIICKRSNSNSTNAGYHINVTTGGQSQYKIADGTAQSNAQSGSLSVGTLYLQAVVRDVANDQVHSYLNSTKVSSADTTTVTLDNTQPFRVNAASNGAAYSDIDVLAVLVYAKALTVVELSNIADYYNSLSSIPPTTGLALWLDADDASSFALTTQEPFTGSNGASWDSGRWPQQVALDTSTLQIQGNKGRASAGGANYSTAHARIETPVALADVDITFTMAYGATGAEQFIRQYIRADGAFTTNAGPTNGYYFLQDNASGFYRIGKRVSSADTNLVSVSSGAYGTTVMNWRIQAIGSSLKLKVWTGSEPGTWTLETIDSSITSSGDIWFQAINGGSSTTRYAEWDDIVINSTEVAQWNDKSGNGSHCIQSTSASRPRRKALLNGRSSVVFDGTDDVLASSSFSLALTTGFTVYIVARESTAVSDAGIFCVTDGTGSDADDMGSFAIDTGTTVQWLRAHANLSQNAAIWEMDFGAPGSGAAPVGVNVLKAVGASSSALNLYRNGSLVASDTGGWSGGPATNYVLGARLSGTTPGTPYFSGHICEVLAYSKIHDDAMRTQIERYLRVKWLNAFDPTSIAGLAQWIDPSDASSITHSSGAVSQINDKSGFGRHFTATTTERPTTNSVTINGLNALDFDGSGNLMTCSSAVVSGHFHLTMFLVCKPDTAPTAGTVPYFNGRGNDGQGWGVALATNTSKVGVCLYGWGFASSTTASPSSGTHLLSMHKSTGSWTGRYDRAVVVTTADVGNSAASNAYLGGDRSIAAGVVPFNGAIGEALIYNRQLTTDEIALVEAYLSAKWGTP